jgi:predicted MPP superfamily phosphohydrolase
MSLDPGSRIVQAPERKPAPRRARAGGLRFRVILIGIFGLFFAYFVAGLALPLRETWVRGLVTGLLAAAIGAILWVPLSFWQRETEETSPLERALLWIAFCAMGVLSFTLVLLVARDLASLVVTRDLRTEGMSGLILGAAAGLFLLGYARAHYGVGLRRVTVPIEKLPSELAGLRILQITDLHVGPTIRKPFVEKVVKLAADAAPDLVVVTGDLGDGKVRELEKELAPLSALRAPLGQYYVTGNHEYYWEGGPWIQKARELGFEPLLNGHAIVRKGAAAFAIAGVPDPAAEYAGQPGPDLDRAFDGIPEDAFPRIFLCHQPKFAADAEAHGATLQISGHTHGGQFFPWTLVASLVHRFNYGLHRLGSMWIYVSRGTGYWGPPVRVGSPAEITLLELVAAAGE